MYYPAGTYDFSAGPMDGPNGRGLMLTSDNAKNADTLGRWINNGVLDTHRALTVGDQDWLRSRYDYFKPVLLRNVRAEKFQATFSMEGVVANNALFFLFDAKDMDDYNLLRLQHYASGTAPYGHKIEDGGLYSYVNHNVRNSDNVPDLPDNDTLWYRINYDGTRVKVWAVKDNDASTGDAVDWTEVSTCYESEYFDVSGGRIGFGGAGVGYVDNLTVKIDGNDDGDFADAEDKIQTLERFEIDGSDYSENEKLAHDAAGNLTYDGEYKYIYDAWNRLVEVKRAYRPTSTTLTVTSKIATMTYDGLGRRIKKAITNCGDWNATYQYYYDGQRMIEVRDGSDLTLKQCVWGQTYVDELVQIAINQDPENADPEAVPTESKRESACERLFYPLQDANYNVLGVVNAAGDLVERYEYTPYGQRTIYSHGWLYYDLNVDGIVNNDPDPEAGQDDVDFLDAEAQKSAAEQKVSVADLDGDGDVDNDDKDLLLARLGIESDETAASTDHIPANDTLVTFPVMESFRARDVLTAAENTGLCDVGHQGLLHDKEFGLIHNRARTLHPRLGRFLQRDPVGYQDGMSLYEYLRTRPTTLVDAPGLAIDSQLKRALKDVEDAWANRDAWEKKRLEASKPAAMYQAQREVEKEQRRIEGLLQKVRDPLAKGAQVPGVIPPPGVLTASLKVEGDDRRYLLTGMGVSPKDFWEAIAKNELEQADCPPAIKLPQALAYALDKAWALTVSTRAEAGGVLSRGQGGRHLIWGPILGEFRRGWLRASVPPHNAFPRGAKGALGHIRSGVYGSYHTHPPERGPKPRGSIFSLGDIHSSIRMAERIALMRDCKGTHALVFPKRPDAKALTVKKVRWPRFRRHGTTDEQVRQEADSAAQRGGLCYYYKSVTAADRNALDRRMPQLDKP